MGNVIELQKPRPVVKGGYEMEWLVFQLSLEGGEDGEWISVHPEDLPAWVMESNVVRDMRDGKMVCGDPAKGRLWFRVILCDPPSVA